MKAFLVFSLAVIWACVYSPINLPPVYAQSLFRALNHTTTPLQVITALVPGTTRSDNGCFGEEFTANRDLNVTGVRRWNVSGNTGTSDVYIARKNGITYTILGSATVTRSSPSSTWSNAGTVSFTITSGWTFAVMADEQLGQALLENDMTGVSYSGDVTFTGSAYLANVCSSLAALGYLNLGGTVPYGAPNADYLP